MDGKNISKIHEVYYRGQEELNSKVKRTKVRKTIKTKRQIRIFLTHL